MEGCLTKRYTLGVQTLHVADTISDGPPHSAPCCGGLVSTGRIINTAR